MTESPLPHDDIDLLLQRWADAELRGDTTALDDLLAPDFTGVGPLGFVLSRADWLQRHGEQGLVYTSYGYDEVSVQRHPGCTVVVARLKADGTWQGHAVPGVLRTGMVLVPTEGGWQVTFTQHSFMAGTPGAPPIPGRPATGEPS
jgi:hypothetical protein